MWRRRELQAGDHVSEDCKDEDGVLIDCLIVLIGRLSPFSDILAALCECVIVEKENLPWPFSQTTTKTGVCITYHRANQFDESI